MFQKAINLVKTICYIPEKDIFIIIQSRQTLLFNNKESWLRKCGNEELMFQGDALMVLKFAS